MKDARMGGIATLEVLWLFSWPERPCNLFQCCEGYPRIGFIIGGRWNRECFLEREKLGMEFWHGTILPGESKEYSQEISNRLCNCVVAVIDMPMYIGGHKRQIKEMIKGKRGEMLDVMEKAEIACESIFIVVNSA